MTAVVMCAVVPALYVDAGLWLLDALVFFVVGSVAFLLLAGAADDGSGHGAGSAGAVEGVAATVPASVWCRPRGVVAAVGFFARSLGARLDEGLAHGVCGGGAPTTARLWQCGRSCWESS